VHQLPCGDLLGGHGSFIGRGVHELPRRNLLGFLGGGSFDRMSRLRPRYLLCVGGGGSLRQLRRRDLSGSRRPVGLHSVPRGRLRGLDRLDAVHELRGGHGLVGYGRHDLGHLRRVHSGHLRGGSGVRVLELRCGYVRTVHRLGNVFHLRGRNVLVLRVGKLLRMFRGHLPASKRLSGVHWVQPWTVLRGNGCS
jgi:hypothetical protein